MLIPAFGTGNYLRVRGEYIEDLDKARDMLELPPRARRIHPPWCPPRLLRGTTSACAENTRAGDFLLDA